VIIAECEAILEVVDRESAAKVIDQLARVVEVFAAFLVLREAILRVSDVVFARYGFLIMTFECRQSSCAARDGCRR